MTKELTPKEKKAVLKHLENASDEVEAAINVLFGSFYRPYNRLYNAWKVINFCVGFFQEKWSRDI